MRTIKFRAYDSEDKRMVYPDQLRLGMQPRKQTPKQKKIEQVQYFWAQVLEYPNIFTVMQYTGLKDKNGKEIWEGDLLKLKHKGRECVSKVVWEQREVRHDYEGDYVDLNGYIKWGGWEHKRADGQTTGNLSMHEGGVEVIGNRFENPELLGQS